MDQADIATFVMIGVYIAVLILHWITGIEPWPQWKRK